MIGETAFAVDKRGLETGFQDLKNHNVIKKLEMRQS